MSKGPILSGPEDMRLRANIKATLQALQGYIEMGGYSRAAQGARDLADLLDSMAERDRQADQAHEPRHRVYEPPASPRSGPEWLGAGKYDERPERKPRRRRITVTEVDRAPNKPVPELPEP